MGAFWLNLLGNQLVWLVAVWGAGRGWQWPALVAAGLFVARELAVTPTPGVQARLLVLCLFCGLGVDGVAAASGTVQYAAAPWGWLPPPWILALWAAFAMTVTVSMRFLQRHLVLASLTGLVFAPLAYLAAARGWDAVAFAPPAWQGLLVLGLGWSVALPVLAGCARAWTGTAAPAMPLNGATR